MALNHPLKSIFLIFVSLLLVVACSDQASSETKKNTAANENFLSYSKDGLSLRYPAHWAPAYDELNSLYADRDASFSPTEFSRVSVLIYDDNTIDEVNLADRFARILKLESRKNVKDYAKTALDISGFKSVRLSWKDTLLTPVLSEMTIVKVGNSPKATFAVFNLTEEDIANESVHMTAFINSISLQ